MSAIKTMGRTTDTMITSGQNEITWAVDENGDIPVESPIVWYKYPMQQNPKKKLSFQPMRCPAKAQYILARK
jgi:hypothetical protein